MAKRGRNEGAIFKKANGTWRAQVSIDGKRISHTAGSRAECNDWLKRTLNQIDQGMTFEGQNLTLSEYLEEWIKIKKNALRTKDSAIRRWGNEGCELGAMERRSAVARWRRSALALKDAGLRVPLEQERGLYTLRRPCAIRNPEPEIGIGRLEIKQSSFIYFLGG